jgi:hypothetical protein
MARAVPAEKPRWRQGLVNPRLCPDDFDLVFVEIGRLACEEHYRVGRFVIDHWLEKSGKRRLIDARAEHVAKNRVLTCKDIAQVLSVVYPVPDREVGFITARHAAQYLRVIRNGGFIVSPAGDGLWWVGSRRRTAAELVELAKSRGFDPASLSGGGEAQ